MQRLVFIITGQVQGVGFRPFVYRLAAEEVLTGFVLNDSKGVRIEIQGSEDRLKSFSLRLRDELPPLAAIVSLEWENMPVVEAEERFVIQASRSGAGHSVLISPDVATCPDCLQDIFAPKNRRYGYAFTNCTNCGPRFTITARIPYDRPSTSMACFPLCTDCRLEYEDPLDRRFHAQPNACPVCGPRLWLQKNEIRLAEGSEALAGLVQKLAEGGIAAVKGLGGFHLVCDAANPEAVRTLRARKKRFGKPLAVMVPDLATARSLCCVDPTEADLLSGIKRPIVLLRRKEDCPLDRELAPDTDYLGIMLPYTPLHHLILARFAALRPKRIPALVMTSGNMSSEPICLGNREALSRLTRIADLFLLHDRDILIRCDDSVVRVVDGRAILLRRARGYTPSPVFLPRSGPSVFGTGPELKATMCLTKGNQAFPSQHIGDMSNLETMEFYREMAAHLPDILQCEPKAQVRDVHPNYMTTAFAQERSHLPTMTLQHHVAHVWACIAENRIDEPCLGIALDGTGLGEDGTLWGGELFLVDPIRAQHQRIGRLARVRLPGGDQAVVEPWRIAKAFVHSLGLAPPAGRAWPWMEQYATADSIVQTMLDRGINSPISSSCGRLFDAVSALLGLCLVIDYEGQAAIRLESAQAEDDRIAYPCPLRHDEGLTILDTHEIFKCVFIDWRNEVPTGIISGRFHRGLIRGLVDWTLDGATRTGIRKVVLSGGVFQNATLARCLPTALQKRDLEPSVHTLVPPNDACISLGQAWYGICALEAEEK